MARIVIIDPQSSTGKAKTLLDAVQSKMKMVPNLMRVLASSPAALEGYLNFNEALSHGLLSGKLRELISVVVAAGKWL
jgi:alkylhydroperoxidase family enzyme